MGTPTTQVHIFGIRHHGPGSAYSVLRALEAVAPDIVLVEGPPDAAEALSLAGHPEMQPPVALLLYVPDNPQQSVFYPFAVFSPEWQALQFALTRQLPVRFIDLPLAHQLAMKVAQDTPMEDTELAEDPDSAAMPQDASPAPPSDDPLTQLARLAGYADGESWWEAQVETRKHSIELFAVVQEAMAELRANDTRPPDPLEAPREAWMRQAIRVAQKEGFANIAVVCGAWHAPALAAMPPAARDAALLKGLPKCKVESTWIPWTYQRLAFRSGYGAGIHSPGWYHHVWTTPEETCTIAWAAKTAHLFRQQDLDASSAHIIEVVRLAETLAAMRDLPQPGLQEITEATQAVMCLGDPLPLRFIHDHLAAGEVMGAVPPDTPLPPLARDLQQRQKRLRMPPEAAQKVLDLDLRNATDMARSKLLHTLRLLEIPWGTPATTQGAKGTFHELWQLHWQPEFAVQLMEAGCWGNTIEVAAEARACAQADRAHHLPALAAMLDVAILADLPGAVAHVMQRINTEAAVTSDLAHLMQALPPLVQILRYGNVRQTDTAMIAAVVDGMVARTCVGLPALCSAITDEAAMQVFRNIIGVQHALAVLAAPEQFGLWYEALTVIGSGNGYHGLPAGRACRILLDAGIMEVDAIGVLMSRALSPSVDPAQAAAWLEGFLHGSGMLLITDDRLWQMVDAWVCAVPSDLFTALLPLVRRTVATFPLGERRLLGERIKRGAAHAVPSATGNTAFDPARAARVLPIVAALLGVSCDEGGAQHDG